MNVVRSTPMSSFGPHQSERLLRVVNIRRQRLRNGLAILAVTLGVLAVYWHGLTGPFVLDDFSNLLEPVEIRLNGLTYEGLREAAYAQEKAYPHRGLARMSFALNYYLAGGRFDAFWFKLTNVAIHVLAGLVLYWLSALLTRRLRRPPGGADELRWLPMLVAGVWLLHPIQLTSVLYVVQRMTSLSGLFVFLGLTVFVYGRERLESGRGSGLIWMAGGVGGGTLLGFLCKENAVLLPFLALLVEWVFFGFAPPLRRHRYGLYVWYAVSAVLPALVAISVLALNWQEVVASYGGRDFTLEERLWTQGRLLWFYVGLMLVPNVRWYGLYHDDIAYSVSWIEPWTTLPSALAWVAVGVLALWGLKRRQVWAFGVVWYLTGHVLESSVIALEMVFEHRNYVPSYGLMFAGMYYLSRLGERMLLSKGMRYGCAVAVLAVLGATTASRAATWSSMQTFTEVGVRNHPSSYRYLNELGHHHARSGEAADAIVTWRRASRLKQSEVMPLIEISKLLHLRLAALTQDEPRLEEPDMDEAHPVEAMLSAASSVNRELADLSDEIARRLSHEPLTPSTVSAFRRLRLCAQAGQYRCLMLRQRTREWARLALANERASPSFSAMMMIEAGLIAETEGLSNDAVEFVRTARRLAPALLDHDITLFYLLVRLDRFDEARETLDAVSKVREGSGLKLRELRQARETLQRLSEAK